MQPRLSLMLLFIVFGWLLVSCGGSESSIRTTVEATFQATVDGLNQNDLGLVTPYFATAAEGANAAGLDATLGKLQEFASGLRPGDRVQVHSFRVESIEVHEGGNLARAGYRMHLSIVRNGQVIFGFVATQNLALTRMGSKWLISGGDDAQLTEVLGQWPLPAGFSR